jgi:hypothetical protein
MGAFKGWQSVRRNPLFTRFPNINQLALNNVFGFPGCYFMLDANLEVSPRINGSAINSWSDPISKLTFTNTNAARLPFFTESNSNFNNNPSINFNTNNKYLLSDIALKNNNQNTYVVVYQINNTNASRNMILSNGLANQINGLCLCSAASVAEQGFGIYDTNTPVMAEPTYNFAPKIGVISASDVIVNGVNVDSGIWTPPSAFNQIGHVNTAFPCVAQIALILGFNYSLSSADCIRLSDNVNSRFLVY